MIAKNAQVYETAYRKKRNGIKYRMVVIHYADGSGEKFLVPPDRRANAIRPQ